jgi:hypothetical protein
MSTTVPVRLGAMSLRRVRIGVLAACLVTPRAEGRAWQDTFGAHIWDNATFGDSLA